jgi:hypothetical protein
MSTSLSSMSGSCLQQRDSGYPYMFHDPLSSLSSTYNSRAAAAAAACNPAMAAAAAAAHGGSHHSSYSSPVTTSSSTTGTSQFFNTIQDTLYFLVKAKKITFLFFRFYICHIIFLLRLKNETDNYCNDIF